MSHPTPARTAGQRYFLGAVTIYDGEHEHASHCIVLAKDAEEAGRILAFTCHEVGDDEDRETVWGFGDGMTASHPLSIVPLTEREAKRLQTLNVAHMLDVDQYPVFSTYATPPTTERG